MLRKLAVLVIVAATLGLAMSGYAQEPAAAQDHNAGTKLAQGVVNGVTFPIEFPKQIYLTTKSDNILSGLTFGMAKGICYGLLRLASGVYDTVTCVIPPYGKVQMEPKYVFEGWE